MEYFEELQNKRLSVGPIVCRQARAHQSCQNQYWKETRTLPKRKSLIQIFILTSCCNHDNCKCYCFKLNAQLNHYYLRELYNHSKHSTSACKKSTNIKNNKSIPMKLFQNWIFSSRWGLWNLGQRQQSQKNKFTFFSQNLFSIPRDIPWHHWKNLLTSKRGHSGGLNFFTKFGQIWLKTSGGSRDLNFDRICKCHTILESSWLTDLIFQEPHDLRGHWRLPEATEIEKNGQRNFWA